MTPYGGEHAVTSTCAYHYKFTGKERDSETGNDSFPHRYYASLRGRWMTPDPGGMGVAHPGDPQTWNMYAYVRNNPTTLNDPTGLEPADAQKMAGNESDIAADWNPVWTNGAGSGQYAFNPIWELEQQQHPEWNYVPCLICGAPDPAQVEEGQNTQTPTARDSIPPGYRTIVVPNVDGLQGKKLFGTGWCTDLAKANGAPGTAEWAPGPAPDANTPRGTLVAVFSADHGTRYVSKHGVGHVGAFLGIEAKTNKPGHPPGIALMDQFRGKKTIGAQEYAYGDKRSNISDAGNYRIVFVPKREGQ